jgi:hypothetical protein
MLVVLRGRACGLQMQEVRESYVHDFDIWIGTQLLDSIFSIVSPLDAPFVGKRFHLLLGGRTSSDNFHIRDGSECRHVIDVVNETAPDQANIGLLHCCGSSIVLRRRFAYMSDEIEQTDR